MQDNKNIAMISNSKQNFVIFHPIEGGGLDGCANIRGAYGVKELYSNFFLIYILLIANKIN